MSGGAETRPATVVVGAGVVGLAAAYALLGRGRRVEVLESREAPGAGASGAAGGMLAPISEAAEAEEPELVALGQESLALYPEFVEGLERLTDRSCGYRTEGTLWVAVNRDDREELERLERNLRRRDLDALWLGAAEAARHEPHLSGRVLGGLLVERDHQVDPRRLVACLARAVERLGGDVFCGTTVEAVEAVGGRVVAVRGRDRGGNAFRRECGELVLAAGAWSASVELPLVPPHVRPVKGQLVRLRGEPLIRHVIRTPDVYLIPREDGELLVGATTEEVGFDEGPTAGAVMDLLRHAWEVLPACYDSAVEEISVGLRGAVEDHLPVIGPTAVEGLYLALGHYRNGILLAPVTAHYLAQAVVDGRVPGGLEPFLPDRRPTRAGTERRR